jgi:hypothetical protein
MGSSFPAGEQPPERAAHQNNVDQQRQNDEATNARQPDQFPALRKIVDAAARGDEDVETIARLYSFLHIQWNARLYYPVTDNNQFGNVRKNSKKHDLVHLYV